MIPAPSRPCPNPLCDRPARLLGGIWHQECTHTESTRGVPMSEAEPMRVPCSIQHPHDAHVYQSFIAGGPVGPVPSLTCICPGSMTVPISRELAIESGLIQPTSAEAAKRAADNDDWIRRRAVAEKETADFVAAIITNDPLARKILDLHSTDGNGWHATCSGCDYAGHEGDEPEWPCRTVEAIAEHHGVSVPKWIAFPTRSSDE